MSERFAKDSRAAVVKWALEEARRRGDRRVGTEHLLLGLLRDAGSGAARALGSDLVAARAALDTLDRAALASIGLDLGAASPPYLVASRKRPPLTSAARAVLSRAIKEAAYTKARRPTSKHMLLAILTCEQPDPAAELMAKLGIDPAVVRDRMA
jgi:ATP-dependent Clp protease ATP-binding subunit ClpA